MKTSLIVDLALGITELGLKLAKIVMNDDPNVDTAEDEAAIDRMTARLEKYKQARRARES
jgi:hypothetical protein